MQLGVERGDSSSPFDSGGSPRESVLPVHAVILAGGRGRRLGVRKETVPLGSETFLEAHLRNWQRHCERVSVSVRDRESAVLPDSVEVIVDPPGAESVIDSIAEILSQAAPRPAWIVAVDLPLVPPALLHTFWQTHTPGTSVFGQTERGIEMLCGLYDPTAHAVIASLIERGERKLSRIAEEAPSRVLEESALPPSAVPPLSPFFNVNTPEDLARLRRARGEGESR